MPGGDAPPQPVGRPSIPSHPAARHRVTVRRRGGSRAVQWRVSERRQRTSTAACAPKAGRRGGHGRRKADTRALSCSSDPATGKTLGKLRVATTALQSSLRRGDGTTARDPGHTVQKCRVFDGAPFATPARVCTPSDLFVSCCSFWQRRLFQRSLRRTADASSRRIPLPRSSIARCVILPVPAGTRNASSCAIALARPPRCRRRRQLLAAVS